MAAQTSITARDDEDMMPVGHIIAMARSTVSLCEIQRSCIISRKRRDKKHENNTAKQSPTCPLVAAPPNGSFVQSFHRRALPFPFHNSRCPSLFRDSGKIKFPGIVPGFGSDAVTPIEHPNGICFAAQNHRCSSATSKISESRWARLPAIEAQPKTSVPPLWGVARRGDARWG